MCLAPRSKRADCPCLCSSATQHSRATLSIEVDETSTHSLIDYFHQVKPKPKPKPMPKPKPKPKPRPKPKLKPRPKRKSNSRGMQVNAFIEKAKNNNKCALIHSYYGASLAAGASRGLGLA